MDATDQDDASIVGDECHIVAQQTRGPRSDPNLSAEEIDGYHNLLLLCKVHHKQVDDQPQTYSIDVLKAVKQQHELWVRDTLQNGTTSAASLSEGMAIRVEAGRDILALMAGSHAFALDYDEPSNAEEIELMTRFAGFLDYLGLAGEDLQANDRIQFGFDLTQIIRQLEQQNYYVFGGINERTVKVQDERVKWIIAEFYILRRTNADIQTWP